MSRILRPSKKTCPSFGSSRPVYWHQAIDVGEHALLKGVGLLGFADARLRYTTSGSVVSEAHGYLFETFADLGLIGVVVTLGLVDVAIVLKTSRYCLDFARCKICNVSATQQQLTNMTFAEFCTTVRKAKKL